MTQTEVEHRLGGTSQHFVELGESCEAAVPLGLLQGARYAFFDRTPCRRRTESAITANVSL